MEPTAGEPAKVLPTYPTLPKLSFSNTYGQFAAYNVDSGFGVVPRAHVPVLFLHPLDLLEVWIFGQLVLQAVHWEWSDLFDSQDDRVLNC